MSDTNELQELELIESAFADNVLKNIKVLGGKSTNGRTYTESAMKNSLLKYSNAPVYLNHSGGERKLEERFGTIVNPRLEKDGIYADIDCLTTHGSFNVVKEMYAKNLGKIGCSHVVEGTCRKDGDNIIVESIDKVKSVDLVANPATNHTLKESESEIAQLAQENRGLTEQIKVLSAKIEELSTQNTKLNEEKKVLVEKEQTLTNTLTEKDKTIIELKETNNKWQQKPQSFPLTENKSEKSGKDWAKELVS